MLPIQCASCKHYRDKLQCDAFPKRIPAEILSGEFDHSEPYPGDNGIRYEPKSIQEQERRT
jgi:hypothetical protein